MAQAEAAYTFASAVREAYQSLLSQNKEAEDAASEKQRLSELIGREEQLATVISMKDELVDALFSQLRNLEVASQSSLS